MWGQFNRAPWSDVWFWYSLMCSIEWLRSHVSAICRLGAVVINFSTWHGIGGTQTSLDVGSVQSSPMIWRMILVQFDVLYRMVKVLGQCDLPFQSNKSRLLWVLALFVHFLKKNILSNFDSLLHFLALLVHFLKNIFFEVGSARTSLVIWHTLLVQFFTLYKFLQSLMSVRFVV